MTEIENPYYVILTGSKNNAGDYLIKYRAKELFSELREDRNVIDLNGWESLAGDRLDIVNKSKALILMGGPALQKNMFPSIYPLTENLDHITVPITTMGIGWKSLNGEWNDTRNYPMSTTSLTLLSRINNDGLSASVRDYHTLNILNTKGLNNVIMTGCPATYIQKQIGTNLNLPEAVAKVGFSLGVSFLHSKSLESQMKNMILNLRDYFNYAKFEVVFHHSITEKFLDTHNATKPHLDGHLAFVQWLESKDIAYIDISGSAENLIDYYETCDLHIGYRVHAHIFMNSISKPSMLIAEDGRGNALLSVFGGVVLKAFDGVSDSILSKFLRKFSSLDTFRTFPHFADEFLKILDYEIKNDYPRIRISRRAIDSNYSKMKNFIESLP